MKNRFGFYFAHFSAMLNKHLSKATQCVGLVRKLPRIKNQVTLKGRRDNAKTKSNH